MHIARLGLTPVKGMAHTPLERLDVNADGPPYDRVFCLVEADTGRVLRTVENDLLMACHAAWEPPVLTIRTPVGEATGEVVDGAAMTGFYWEREIKLVTADGPWSPLLSEYVRRPVVLCRVPDPGAVVWAGSVSVVSTSSLVELARRLGRPHDDGARFRPTVVVDTGDAPPFIEDTWVGSRLRLGSAVVTVDERLPRCAVVNALPAAGGRDAAVLKALAGDRLEGTDIFFGVSGDVDRPGRLVTGDPVRLLP
ncbi:MOSC domain-containing protein [Phytoactinopolyspora halotolerans]|uniref:MOSC domain-containing protein n=1 Tax=Phytoactinopolyspora halotolerans TaxID=1981512 RepID=A0A6L9SFH4_9ACTN|nr:MOSC domain-containing protein [Phytoactinopolyspora halotolerans]NEE03368.1 MOSC domain-containing protein [Phytoactinopolyspora halotolerans]